MPKISRNLEHSVILLNSINSTVYLQPHSFGHYAELMTDEGWNVDRQVDLKFRFNSQPLVQKKPAPVSCYECGFLRRFTYCHIIHISKKLQQHNRVPLVCVGCPG